MQFKVSNESNEIIKRYILAAENFIVEEDLTKAKEMYLKAIDLDPYDSVTWQALGHICLLENNLTDAFKCYQGCLQYLNAHNEPQLFFSIGQLYYKMEMYNTCLISLKIALDLKPPK